ncbi:hypothetical protein B0H15DRAFT_807350 [Mycena belliarum]|uniref:Uncharacterized protein n=1 Tax=Mycena belliarum TaxID=1033014 RepID=A0AAD6TLR2_9AGAR|nr:hypothetical protein B0H15DRAFT_807350 [Mycena belliae]
MYCSGDERLWSVYRMRRIKGVRWWPRERCVPNAANNEVQRWLKKIAVYRMGRFMVSGGGPGSAVYRMRASSPFLPSSILPTVRSRQAAPRNAELDTIDEVRHWLYTTQEETRAAKNAEIALLIKSVALDETKAMAARWAKEDYEESYGVFVPDADYPAWLAGKKDAHARLARDREEIIRAFGTEYMTRFHVDDCFEEELDLQYQLLLKRDDIMRRSDGDSGIAGQIAGEQVIRPVSNPYRLSDPRRVEFDAKLRKLYSSYRIDGKYPADKTLLKPSFRFNLPNQHTRDDDRIRYWCRLQVWKDELETIMSDAKEDARRRAPAPRTIPPAQFYTSADSVRF